jgi:ParB family chromosome partitioning protein
MIQHHSMGELRMIPIAQIEVLNPRERNKQVFDQIVDNIRTVGLKKPITVTARPPGADGCEKYLLVCGEGRLKAFMALGESTIAAMVIDVSDEDAFIMSMVENIARRKSSPLELLAGIQQLVAKGYDKRTIARKTGLSLEYVHGIMLLIKNGEERLMVAVESGRIPLNAALAIVGAGNSNEAVQMALQEAYESGQLRGKQLEQARRLIEKRHTFGRTLGRGNSRVTVDVTASSLVRTYLKEVERQKLMVKKAGAAQQRLLFVIGALGQLLVNENFTNLLRAEGLDTLPKYLAERVWPKGN